MSIDEVRQDDRAKFQEMCESSDYQHIVKDTLLKRIIKTGDQNEKCPEQNCKVTVHYTGKLLNGNKFDSSEARNEPFEFNVGLGSVIKGWDQGVPTMCVGERCELVIHPSFGYGQSGQSSIPGGAVLSFEVELLDFIEDDHEYPNTDQEKLDAAQLRKTQGGELFTQGKYKRALRKYEKAAELLESPQNPDDELRKKIDHLKAQAFANCGICQIKMQDNKNGLKNTLEALKIIEEANVDDKALHGKVILRAMQAYIDLQDPESAVRLGEGSAGVLNNDSVKKLTIVAKKKVNEIEAKRDGLYRKMMLGATKQQ